MIRVVALKTQKISLTDRYGELSLMRVIACVGIVVLHTVFAADEYFASTITSGEHFASRLVENNMMWAVPVFLMVTGTLQLDSMKELSLGKLYSKYILRIVIALVAFCIIFRIFDIIMDGEPFTFGSVMVAFRELITGKAWGHLWYLYLLIGLYILLPFYKIITRYCTDRELIYLCLVYFFFVSVIPSVEAFGVPVAFYIGEALIYPLYMLLGYMVHRGRLRIGGAASLVLMLAGTAAIVIMDVCKYVYSMDVPSHMVGYASPAVVLQTLGLFSIMCRGAKATDDGGSSMQLIGRIDSLTFGIYLVHMIFVRLLFKYWQVNPYEYGSGLLLIPIIVGIFLVSLIITWALKKIPGVSRVL